MRTFASSFVSEVYYQIVEFLAQQGTPRSSRVGETIELGAASIILRCREQDWGQRFPILPARRFNPFLAIAEACWILCGQNDVESLAWYLPKMISYSDDGKTLSGAYGHRLRKAGGSDQIESAVELLRQDPDSRRVYLTIWRPQDLGSKSFDVPCNVGFHLRVNGGRLDLTVFNRSNDAFVGLLYDLCAFSILQAYIATEAGLRVGEYTHVTACLHLYITDLERATDTLTHKLDVVNELLPDIPCATLFGSLGSAHLLLDPKSDLSLLDARDSLVAAMLSYRSWRRGHREKALELLPRDEIGLAGLLWYAFTLRNDMPPMPDWTRKYQKWLGGTDEVHS